MDDARPPGHDVPQRQAAHRGRHHLQLSAHHGPKEPEIRGAPALALDYKHLVRVDARTVRFPFTSPFSAFYQLLSDFNYFIVPVGYTTTHPIGTGPFKFESFTPGEQSIFMRNENYWGRAPYVDEVVISDFADETTQVDGFWRVRSTPSTPFRRLRSRHCAPRARSSSSRFAATPPPSRSAATSRRSTTYGSARR